MRNGKCEVCDKGFRAERSTRRYCSGACRVAALHKRRHEGVPIRSAGAATTWERIAVALERIADAVAPVVKVAAPPSVVTEDSVSSDATAAPEPVKHVVVVEEPGSEPEKRYYVDKAEQPEPQIADATVRPPSQEELFEALARREGDRIAREEAQRAKYAEEQRAEKKKEDSEFCEVIERSSAAHEAQRTLAQKATTTAMQEREQAARQKILHFIKTATERPIRSIEIIADMTGLDRKTVRKQVHHLIQAGELAHDLRRYTIRDTTWAQQRLAGATSTIASNAPTEAAPLTPAAETPKSRLLTATVATRPSTSDVASMRAELERLRDPQKK